jgi:hypothetical protein
MRFFHLELEPRSVLGNTAVADESIISFSGDRNNVVLQCYQHVWNQQPSNYKHPTQKPQSTSSHVSIRRHQSSGSRRPLCTPGQSASNLRSSESIRSVQQPLIMQQPSQTAQLFTERSQQKHNQMALFVLNSSLVV